MCAANFFRIAAPVNRPTRKQTKPSDARLDAPLLLIASTPFVRVSNQPRSEQPDVPHATQRGNRRDFGGHVVDEEAEDAGLRGDIEELRGTAITECGCDQMECETSGQSASSR